MRSIDRSPAPGFNRLDELLLSAGCARASVPSRIIALLFGGVFFAGGTAVLIATVLQPLAKCLGSGDWEKTNATITESKLDWDGDSARVDIRYKYRINGTDHTGDRYGWSNDRANFGIGAKRKIIASHSPGSRIAIWFDPDDPSQSVVNRSHTGIDGMSLLFPIPFLLVGVCGLSYALFGGVAAARTRNLMGVIAEEAESKGLVSLGRQLRQASGDPANKLVFTMAQSVTEGLAILFAAIFWNGIVGVFLSLMVVMIISGEGMSLFLGLFLIPFVVIGILLIIATARKLRAARPPAYVFGFSGLSLTEGKTEIPVAWMRLEKGGREPDARNIRLGIGRDLADNPFSAGKSRESPDGLTADYIPVDDEAGQAAFILAPALRDLKKPTWKTRGHQDISAVLVWEEQPRREKRSATWTLIADYSD